MEDSATIPSLQVAHAALPGGWAAAWGHCDDRAIVERTAHRLLTIVADATSPTYGGYFMPLGMDVGLAALQGHLRTHDHACRMPCLVAALNGAHRAMRALEEAIDAEREALRQVAESLTRSARAGGRVAERFGFRGARLVHTAASVTACLIGGMQMHVAQIGSGRVYRRRNGNVELLVRDHTLNAELIAAGRDPDPSHQNVVTRVLGFPDEVQPDFVTFDVEPGDQLLLCSDGVWGGDAALIDEALTASTAQGVCDLVSAGLAKPLRDDAAMIAIRA